MFRNNNQKVINKLAKENLKANKTRNIFTIIAVVLTTILMTSVFTIGSSIIDSMEQATMKQVGTMSHGGLKSITPDQLDKVKDHNLIKKGGVTIPISFAENIELRGKPVEIRYVDENYAKLGFCYPTVGKLPKEDNEIVTSNWVLDNLGVKSKIGEKVTLEYTVGLNKYTKDFVLKGYYEGDKNIDPAGTILVNYDFVNSYIQDDKIAKNLDPNVGKIDFSIMFSNKYNIEDKLRQIVSDSGVNIKDKQYAVNWAYIGTNTKDLSNIIPFVILALMIMLSGYLLIYNILYISVNKDIKSYGLLKTIGTTSKQIKKILLKQCIQLGVIGILIGLIIGYFVGIVLVPIALSTADGLGNCTVISTNPLIFILATIFSFITILISYRKPAKIASMVSPVEAVKYSGVDIKNKKKNKKSTNGAKVYNMAYGNILRNKKKTFIVILSLSLSVILYLCIYTLLSSFDMDSYLSHFIRGDVVIADYSYYRSGHFNGENTVNDKICKDINDIEGVKRIDKVYYGYGSDKLDNRKLEIMNKASITYEGVKHNKKGVMKEDEIDVQIYGLDEGCMSEYKGDTIIKGEFNLEEFNSGDYILLSYDYGCNYYDIGDKVTLLSSDNKEKIFEVMAIVDNVKTFDIGRYHPSGYKAYIKSSDFKEIYDEPTIMKGQIFLDNNINQNKSYENIKSYLKDEKDIILHSKKDYINEYKNFTFMFSTIGYCLSSIIGLIGLFNLINTILTSIYSRKIELAMLESIGMTKNQIVKMITFEGLYYALFTIVITSTIGSILVKHLVKGFGSDMWYFVYNFKLNPLIYSSLGLLFVGIIIPNRCYRIISKMSIIERLREVE